MNDLQILIVEDDAINAMALEATLQRLGHNVLGIVETEDEAVAAALCLTPNLMMVYLWLLKGDGISVIETLDALLPAPHVFLTGDVASVMSRRPGAVVMAKPYTEPELLIAIGAVLAAAHSE